jgi:anti-sigma factor RsiW
MTIPESELHSYIDGQLADQERAVILAELRVSAQRWQQVAELRILKDLIQLAYPPVAQPRPAGCQRSTRMAAKR